MIRTELPKNITPYQGSFFEKEQYYEPAEFKVFERRNVYVTNSGIAFQLCGLIPESVYRYSDRQKKYKLSAIYNFITKRRRKIIHPEKVIFIHNYYCPGYYHWITEALPRLFALREHCNLSELTLVVPEYYPQYVWDSLTSFHFKKIIKTKKTELIFSEKVITVNNVAYGSIHHPGQTRRIGEYFSSWAAAPVSERQKVYITRRGAMRRKIVNEDKVIDLLKSRNFRIVATEEMSFLEQVRLMSSTVLLVSIHGAGLSNMNFMREGGVVIEFYKRLSPGEYLNTSFWRLANACALDYYCLWCEAENRSTSFDESNLVVEISQLQEVIDGIENKLR